MEDGLFCRAKQIAARRETTLTAILEQALQKWLDRQRAAGRRSSVELPVSCAEGGLLPGLHLDDTADRLDRMENDGSP